MLTGLLRPEAFDHPVGQLEMVETHISWVVLTGPFAYKIKKPVNLGFVDYSTVELRRHHCYEELRLNRRLAPQLYLEVVPIREGPCVSGNGPVIEYAVKMRQFPQERLLDRLADRGELSGSHLDSVAEQVARFHLGLRPTLEWGSPDSVWAPVLENFVQLRPYVSDPAPLQLLQTWSERAYERLLPLLRERQQLGFIRECHGDLHLKNMVDEPGGVLIFDGIEFNPNLIWIDVCSEVAFLVMDLQHRDLSALANRFLNRYLELTGDYGSVALLDFYRVYRALVRAKVAAFSGAPVAEAEYLRLAESSHQPHRPKLRLMRGVSGSGKTYQSQILLERDGYVRLRSDVERKRLFGYAPQQDSGSSLGGGIYTEQASELTYQRLLGLARQLLQAGYPVLVDATFLERHQRDPFRELARELGVPFSIQDLQVDPAVARERLQQRNADASEADLAVLERQLSRYAPLAPDETSPCAGGRCWWPDKPAQQYIR